MKKILLIFSLFFIINIVKSQEVTLENLKDVNVLVFQSKADFDHWNNSLIEYFKGRYKVSVVSQKSLLDSSWVAFLKDDSRKMLYSPINIKYDYINILAQNTYNFVWYSYQKAIELSIITKLK